MHAHFFEDATFEDRHHSAAALRARMVGALPRRALKLSGCLGLGEERPLRFILQALEIAANLVAKQLEPALGSGLLCLDLGGNAHSIVFLAIFLLAVRFRGKHPIAARPPP